jgi:lysophospholipid acyltransferase (LPLAT)-like uncharacterized protein
VTVIGRERVLQTMARCTPLVMITWHGRMMVPTWNMRRRNIVAMISRHSDGEMVARLVERLGFDTVRGSSTRGGTQATLEILDKVRAGQTAAMICDGPRGPAFVMKPGAPFLAMQTGARVIPTTASAERVWELHSWDHFIIPKPFSRVYLLWGEPIAPPEASASLKDFTRILDQALNDLTRRADAMARAR